MVLSSMDLLDHSTDARTILPHKDEQVLDDETLLAVIIDNLYMG